MPPKPPADLEPSLDADGAASGVDDEDQSPGGDELQPEAEPGDDGSLSPLARWVGSDDGMTWMKRAVMAVAIAFLIGAIGYFIGVRTTERHGNAVDAGFLRDMTDHHDQAVTMAQLEVLHGADDVARKSAMEVLLFQRQELGRFQNFKNDLRVEDEEYSLDRTTMAWMDMPTPLKNMPGMAGEEQLEQLEKARGTDSDKIFLELMRAHHVGGAHMADYEGEHGADPRIRAMAKGMASNQRIEAREYQALLKRLIGDK
jgi:uncharacterized protein (DUF305 family)